MINSEAKQILLRLTSRPEERVKKRVEVRNLINEINEFLRSIDSHFLLWTEPSQNDSVYYNSLRINNIKGSSYEFDRFIDLDASIEQITEKILVILQEKI